MLQPIDKSLVQKIHTLVGEGVKKVDEMKRHLRHYVKNDLFAGQNPPPVTNRRYHPKDVDIRNHMYKATVKQMLSKVDQENLEEKKNILFTAVLVKMVNNYHHEYVVLTCWKGLLLL